MPLCLDKRNLCDILLKSRNIMSVLPLLFMVLAQSVVVFISCAIIDSLLIINLNIVFRFVFSNMTKHYVLDILVLFSLQRLNFIFDHCIYVHGLALS